MKKYFAALFIAVLLPACGPTNFPTSPAPPSWDSVQRLSYGPAPSWTPELKRVAIGNESRFLKDPDSAKFGFLGARKFVRYSTATQSFDSGYALAFTVNGKNSFGAYVGEKTRALFIRDGRVIDKNLFLHSSMIGRFSQSPNYGGVGFKFEAIVP